MTIQSYSQKLPKPVVLPSIIHHLFQIRIQILSFPFMHHLLSSGELSFSSSA